jgi:predicted helicase
MSHIQTYWRKLNDLRNISGASNESALRRAFENLLEAIGEEHQLILYPEYQFKSPTGANLRADGVLVDRLRLVHGWWEAKDEKDDLDKEITAKLAKGYPTDNIIFEDTRTAVLLQNGKEVLRCSVENAKALQTLLDQFFSYESPEIENFRVARDKFLSELPKVAEALSGLLKTAHQDNKKFQQGAANFLLLCKRSIGERVNASHIDEMLIQHILTDQIFRAVFSDSNFHQENHLASAIGELEKSFFLGETRKNLLKRLEPYFAAIRGAAAKTVTSFEKQNFLKQVYEDFYSAYNPKDADKLGVVYTPQEVVRFMIEGCDWLTQKHFNKRLADSGLDILDPCTGTGTFIVDLLDYLRGDNAALAYKFANEIHANEISILSYYIACLNIEQTFYETTEKWQEFKGACFINTLENWGFEKTYQHAQNDLLGGLTDENHLRIQSQNSRKIPVIIGNPPYNANQQNENDNNQNESAIQVDKRIKETYLDASTAQMTKIYDPYVRFFRWASDRLGEQGILCFISNSSFIDARGFDGFRKTVAQEFQEAWIIDLKGNARMSGERRKREGGNVFDDKIRVGVALYFFVRKAKNTDTTSCEIHYLSVDDFLPAIEKRRWLKAHHLSRLANKGEFRFIRPNARGDWLNQAQENWSHWLPVVSKEVKAGKSDAAIFKLHSLGLNSNRDEWVYDFDKAALLVKMKAFIQHYEAIRKAGKLEFDTEIKWCSSLKIYLQRNLRLTYTAKSVVTGLWRPFVKKQVYFNQYLNHRQFRLRELFGIQGNLENLALGISGNTHAKPFQSLAVSHVPCLDTLEKTQFLPFWVYEADGTRCENITDWALTQFKQRYTNLVDLNKRDIFNYVYAVLHDPRYREKFALNLKAEFPHIPFHPDFSAWANLGAKLIELHAYFEQVTPYPLERVELSSKVAPKCRLKADKTANLIEIDTHTQLKNIPASAWNYQLGNRSALEWVLEQYKEKTPKDPTIREKFNTYRFAEHKEQVIELLMKVCQVSVETMGVIGEIEKLEWS